MYASLVVPNSGGDDVPNSDVYKSATPGSCYNYKVFHKLADWGLVGCPIGQKVGKSMIKESKSTQPSPMMEHTALVLDPALMPPYSVYYLERKREKRMQGGVKHGPCGRAT